MIPEIEVLSELIGTIYDMTINRALMRGFGTRPARVD
jgi:hypothetical protein